MAGVRAAGDHLSVGERIAFYRRRRGLTQAVLAGLVGRSEDWLSKVERGERPVRRLDVLSEVARALRVTVGDLLGQPVLVDDEESHDDVPAIRDALMAPRRLSRVLFGRPSDPARPVDPESAAILVERGWSAYQSGRLGRVIVELPTLIQTAQYLEDFSAEVPASTRRLCLAVSARTHHLAATSLIKVGESDLAWIAAERAMHAADLSDDPLVLGSAARAGTHALLAVGRYADALDLGTTASNWLGERLDESDPAALSLYGMLHLRSAVAAGLRRDRPLANELLAKAANAGDRLGRDANYWQTGFGPTNIELHRVSVALQLEDVSFVVERGRQLSVEHMPQERRVSFRIDVARGLSLTAQDDEALAELLDAEKDAPQLVRHNPMVREMVRAMHRRAPVAAGRSSLLLALAERCRAMELR